MPYTRKNKKSKKARRSNAVRRYRSGYNQGVSKRIGFPKSMMTKMRFCATHALDPGTATIASYQFRANDVYDPDYSGAGHQPLGFDQYSQLYEHFTVLGSKITVTAATSGSVPVVIGITKDSDATRTTSFDTIQEQPDTCWKVHTPGSPAKQLSCRLSAKKWFNKLAVKDSDRLQGTNLASPEEVVFYHLWAKGLSASVDPSAIDCNITIDYIVLWTEPKELPQS